jgi:hypothetical protein
MICFEYLASVTSLVVFATTVSETIVSETIVSKSHDINLGTWSRC